MPKHRYLSVSEAFVDSSFVYQYKTGFDSGARPYRIISGLPEDAKLVDIKLLEHPTRMLMFIVHSESFEDVDDIYSLPSLTITATIYEAVNDKKTKDKLTA